MNHNWVPIPEDKIQAAYLFHQEHPNLSWRELSNNVGIHPTTLRHILRRRWGVTKRQQPATVIPEVVTKHRRKYQVIPVQIIKELYDAFDQHPQPTLGELADQFGISQQSVRNYLKKRSPGIPNRIIHEGKDGDEFTTDNSFYKSLVNHVAYVSGLESENTTLKEQLREKGASNSRITEIMAKLQYELAHRD